LCEEQKIHRIKANPGTLVIRRDN